MPHWTFGVWNDTRLSGFPCGNRPLPCKQITGTIMALSDHTIAPFCRNQTLASGILRQRQTFQEMLAREFAQPLSRNVSRFCRITIPQGPPKNPGRSLELTIPLRMKRRFLHLQFWFEETTLNQRFQSRALLFLQPRARLKY